jgi:SAM-dependent methyltransferase
MRATWDAAAASPRMHAYVGDPATARSELEGLFARLGAHLGGEVCVEVGCGPGRMTGYLAERFRRVIAVDVSPAMLARARQAVPAANVEFLAVSGRRLDGVADGVADALVCYLVLQHLPRRRLICGYLQEFARVLAPAGRALVQIPVLAGGLRPRLWRRLRGAALPVAALLARDPGGHPAYRGFRLTEAELGAAIAAAGLRVAARDESPVSPYRYAREVFLRLERGT